MNNWNEGYVTDMDYTFGYYRELNPLRAKLAFLDVGIVFPEIKTACELGFGQGISVNIHAAASKTEWYGTDFNPTQAAFAKDLAKLSEANAKLFDDSFENFAKRDDIPEFDYIGLHGIWSWVSEENRKTIVDFIDKKLKVGGVLYVSYNTLPGWSAFAPVRHLMTKYAEIADAKGTGIAAKIGNSIAFTEKLLETKPAFAIANPQVNDRFNRLKTLNLHYLAHEYFNRDWRPMYFSDIADLLSEAKLQYACSANYINHINDLNLTQDHQKFLASIPNQILQETTRDFMVNENFRRDYWIKGARRLNISEQEEALRKLSVVLTINRSNASLKIKSNAGDAQMKEEIYNPILDILADNKPKTLGEIENRLKSKNIILANVVQAAMVLSGTEQLELAQDEDAIAAARKQTDKLNVYLSEKTFGNNDVIFLASPVTGGGIPLNRFQQLFVNSINKGNKNPEEWAKDAWDILNAQNLKLVKNEKTLETEKENIEELKELATVFAEKRLPVLRELQVIQGFLI